MGGVQDGVDPRPEAGPGRPLRGRTGALWCVGILSALPLVSCEPAFPETARLPGAPLPGLGAEELERFRAGEALFSRAFTPDEGLGPRFNADRCISCHDLPTSGGTGVEDVTTATRWDEEDMHCDQYLEMGGPVTRLYEVPGIDRQAHGPAPQTTGWPAGTALAEITPASLYGLGLVEAIADEAILSRAGWHDRGRDGLAGRPGRSPDGRLGRFGRKADNASLVDFVAKALLSEMGITTPFHPHAPDGAGARSSSGTDAVGGPELQESEVRLLADYIRFLAPPEPLVPRERSERRRVADGEGLFHRIGCSGCHVPEFTTGPNDLPALDRRTVRLYSDLLLHDMGPAVASICAPDAGPSMWRTGILVGLRYRRTLLHDGRAHRIADAILLHGGEAEPARDEFQRLSTQQRENLVAFLRTL